MDQWSLDDIWAILWCGVLHDCEESLIGDPPRGLGAVPELGPALKRYKRKVRAIVADTLTMALGVDPLPPDAPELAVPPYPCEARDNARRWSYVHRADGAYAIDLERRAHPTPPVGCVTLNDSDALAFELAPDHAAVLAGWRDQVAPWRLPFELACATLAQHLRNLAGLRDAAWREAGEHIGAPQALMALARGELESVFSAKVLGDQRVALFERPGGTAWVVEPAPAPAGWAPDPAVSRTPEGWGVYGADRAEG